MSLHLQMPLVGLEAVVGVVGVVGLENLTWE